MASPRLKNESLPFSSAYSFTPVRHNFDLGGRRYQPGEEIDKSTIGVDKLAHLFKLRKITILAAPDVPPVTPKADPVTPDPASPPPAGTAAAAAPADAKNKGGRPKGSTNAAKAATGPAKALEPDEIGLVSKGFGKFDVMQGTTVLRAGLVKDDAELFAEGARKRVAAGKPAIEPKAA